MMSTGLRGSSACRGRLLGSVPSAAEICLVCILFREKFTAVARSLLYGLVAEPEVWMGRCGEEFSKMSNESFSSFSCVSYFESQ